MTDKPKRPRDVNQLAGSIVDIATGEAYEIETDTSGQRKGGLKGGKARAEKLSPEDRQSRREGPLVRLVVLVFVVLGEDRLLRFEKLDDLPDFTGTHLTRHAHLKCTAFELSLRQDRLAGPQRRRLTGLLRC